MSRDRVLVPYRRVEILIREDAIAHLRCPEDWLLNLANEYLPDGCAAMPVDIAPKRRRVKAQPATTRKAPGKPKAAGKARTRRAVSKLAAVLPIRQEAPTAAHGEP